MSNSVRYFIYNEHRGFYPMVLTRHKKTHETIWEIKRFVNRPAITCFITRNVHDQSSSRTKVCFG